MEDAFNDAIERLRATLTDKIAPSVKAQREEQLKPAVLRLLSEAGATIKRDVAGKAEAQLSLLEIAGRPDLGVAVDKALCGYVELKSPGFGARTENYTGHDKVQWENFKRIPNILYTDGMEWALYRTGQRQRDVIELFNEKSVRKKDAGVEVSALLLDLLRDFLIWEPIVPESPKALAIMLAPLCQLLRDEVLSRMGDSNSKLIQLKVDWGRYLIRHQTNEQFADAYAQTVTYALLLAKLEGATKLRAPTAWEKLRSGHGLLAEALRGLADPNVCEEIGVPIDLLERSINEVNSTKLYRKSKDPWIYFYEDFLAEYDPILRKDRGVYFTPHEVVKAQVTLISQLLTERFGRKFGFADDGVLFIDPAVGTGAYPVAAIEHGLALVRESRGEGAVPGLATVAGENLHAFEILVGPYTVAHLRTTQTILAAKGRLPAGGVNVLLTDTLESPFAQAPKQTPLIYQTLNTEHLRAANVKARTEILVCLGNPPYDRHGASKSKDDRKGGWIRQGDAAHGYSAILEDFAKPAVAAGYGVHLKNLYNDYVYFWRWALWKVFESTKGPGIVSFITAASYLRGPAFAGMRKVMRETFDDLWIIDLGGDNRGTRKSDNVFAIETPVAIAVGVRYGPAMKGNRAKVHYSRVDGSQDKKLAALSAIEKFDDLKWRPTLAGLLDPFVPKGKGQFFAMPMLTDLFPWQHSGAQFKRRWPIAETPTVLKKRWAVFLEATPEKRAILFKTTRDRSIDRRYPTIEEGGKSHPPLASLAIGTQVPSIGRYAYRSFDRQWALLDNRLGDYLRPALFNTMGTKQIFLVSMLTGVLGEGQAAMVTSHLPDLDSFRGSFGAKHVVPLWRDRVGQSPNIAAGVLNALNTRIRIKVGAEDIFAYCYSILGNPSYTRRFWEQLSEPGPRLPITTDAALFRKGVRLGKELIWLHTYGERMQPDDEVKLPRGQARNVKSVSQSAREYPKDFAYDAARKSLRVGDGEFGPVSKEIWEYNVSGLEVVRSWLRYRMKDGAGKKSSPLDDIRPEHWSHEFTEELLELLWVLEACVEIWPQLDSLLENILDSNLMSADEFPSPTDAEREPPGEDSGEDELDLAD